MKKSLDKMRKNGLVRSGVLFPSNSIYEFVLRVFLLAFLLGLSSQRAFPQACPASYLSTYRLTLLDLTNPVYLHVATPTRVGDKDIEQVFFAAPPGTVRPTGCPKYFSPNTTSWAIIGPNAPLILSPPMSCNTSQNACTFQALQTTGIVTLQATSMYQDTSTGVRLNWQIRKEVHVVDPVPPCDTPDGRCFDLAGLPIPCGGGCAVDSCPATSALSLKSSAIRLRSAASTAIGDLQISPTCDPRDIPVDIVTSLDPNDKVGAQGFGQMRFTSGAEPLKYLVEFENKDTATAPALEVVITDQLDSFNMDLNTFSLGPILFGRTQLIPTAGLSNYSTSVDLRPANNLLVKIDASLDKTTGLLTWSFASLDPNTGQPPTDPLAGFLPPGVGGSVFFTIMPKSVLSTGAQIRNSASIAFDVNAPILTPEWLNTIDNTKPTSHVLPLAATQTSYTFPVQWSATDVGAGVQDFTVYVSDNGGPFSAFQTNTTAASATFAGQSSHTYAFYSIGRDLVGNVEVAKTVAEATTQVLLDTTPPVTKASLSGPAGNNGWYRGPVTVTLTATDPDSPVAASSYSLDGGATVTYKAPFTIPADGIHQLSFWSVDPAGNQEKANSLTVRIDATPAVIIASANPSTFWPPNGKMVSVTVFGTITDATSGVNPNSATFAVVDKYGSVQPNGNVTLAANGTYSFPISLQASRLGTDQNGRTYTITVTAQDNAGNQNSASTAVVVPHDQGH